MSKPRLLMMQAALLHLIAPTGIVPAQDDKPAGRHYLYPDIAVAADNDEIVRIGDSRPAWKSKGELSKALIAGGVSNDWSELVVAAADSRPYAARGSLIVSSVRNERKARSDRIQSALSAKATAITRVANAAPPSTVACNLPLSAMYEDYANLPYRIRDNQTGVEFILIPDFAALFSAPMLIGEPRSAVRQVLIAQSTPFYIAATCVTWEQFERGAGDPSLRRGYGDPCMSLARGLTWLEAAKYCESNGMRLPTEAEWMLCFRLSCQFSEVYSNTPTTSWPNLEPVAVGDADAFGFCGREGRLLEFTRDSFKAQFWEESIVVNGFCLTSSEVILKKGRSWWDTERLNATYRRSGLKSGRDDDGGFRPVLNIVSP